MYVDLPEVSFVAPLRTLVWIRSSVFRGVSKGDEGASSLPKFDNWIQLENQWLSVIKFDTFQDVFACFFRLKTVGKT